MENTETYHSELISKYLAGEITEEETRVLKGWLQSDAENQKLFEEFRNTWLAIEYSKIDPALIINEEWGKLKVKIQVGQADGRTESQQSAVSSQDVKTTRGKTGFIPLDLFSNTGKTSFSQWVMRIAAVFILFAIPAFLLFRYFDNSTKKVITAQNNMVDTSLPDGTFVSLNRGSTIEYPEHFSGNNREIKLTGEAYFSVKHDDKSKFVIANGNVRIEDIGTSFYVNTHKSAGQMEVVLTEGKAMVYFKDNPSGQVVISAGERADIGLAGNNIIKSINHDENYIAWKTKRFVFTNNTLIEVVTILNKGYHSDIRISGNNINNCRLTAIFDNQSLESVLNVIKSTLDVSIISNGSTFEISGRKCDL
jgi:transmembrane sensor